VPINPLLSKLKGGDLRSDGRSNEVTKEVLENISLLPDLIQGLSVKDDVVRGRTADSLEKLGRSHHNLLIPYLPLFLEKARNDPIYMVRFHLAMIFSYLEIEGPQQLDVIETLINLLEDESVFVVSWSIVSLTIIGLGSSELRDKFVNLLKPFKESESIALKRRAETAIDVLDGIKKIPKGWVKKQSSKRVINK
jgi:HEAT repeat protein